MTHNHESYALHRKLTYLTHLSFNVDVEYANGNEELLMRRGKSQKNIGNSTCLVLHTVEARTNFTLEKASAEHEYYYKFSTYHAFANVLLDLTTKATVYK